MFKHRPRISSVVLKQRIQRGLVSMVMHVVLHICVWKIAHYMHFHFDSKHLGCQKFLYTFRFVTHYKIKCVRHTFHICMRQRPKWHTKPKWDCEWVEKFCHKHTIHWIVLCSNVMISRTHPVSCKIFYIALYVSLVLWTSRFVLL